MRKVKNFRAKYYTDDIEEAIATVRRIFKPFVIGE